MCYSELDIIRTTRAILNGDVIIPKNTKGTIVHHHMDQMTLEIEFTGEHQSVLTLKYGKDVIVDKIITKDSSSAKKEDIENDFWKSLERNQPVNQKVKDSILAVKDRFDFSLLNDLPADELRKHMDTHAEKTPEHKLGINTIANVLINLKGRKAIIHGS